MLRKSLYVGFSSRFEKTEYCCLKGRSQPFLFFNGNVTKKHIMTDEIRLEGEATDNPTPDTPDTTNEGDTGGDVAGGETTDGGDSTDSQ